MSADLEKLLPCPFCGEPAKSYVSRDDDHDRYGEVCCTGCAASVRGPHLHWMDNTADEIASQFQAEMGWNRRTPAPVVPAEGLDAAMREAIDLLAERKQGSSARSPGHNARLVLEAALRSAPPVGARVSIPSGLIDALRSQRQIDADGCEVAVSRQACDEAAAILAALLPAGEGK